MTRTLTHAQELLSRMEYVCEQLSKVSYHEKDRTEEDKKVVKEYVSLTLQIASAYVAGGTL